MFIITILFIFNVRLHLTILKQVKRRYIMECFDKIKFEL